MDHEKIHLEPGETCRCRKRRKLFAKPLDFSEKRSIVRALQQQLQWSQFSGNTNPSDIKYENIFFALTF